MLVEIVKMSKEEVTVVSSLDVAETFEKRHDHVLRDIEKLKKISPILGRCFLKLQCQILTEEARKFF